MPLATRFVGERTSEERSRLAEPASPVTVVVSVTPPNSADTVFGSALVVLNAEAKLPVASVVPVAGRMVSPAPELDRPTATPAARLAKASAAVSTRPSVWMLSATTELGVATNDEFASTGGPATNVALPDKVRPANVAVTVFVSALVAVSVVVNVPAELVLPLLARMTSPTPLLVRVTGTAATPLPKASRTATVTPVAALPFATTFEAAICRLEVASTGGPAKKVTVAVVDAGLADNVIVFVSARLERKSVLTWPALSVDAPVSEIESLPSVLLLENVAARSLATLP